MRMKEEQQERQEGGRVSMSRKKSAADGPGYDLVSDDDRSGSDMFSDEDKSSNSGDNSQGMFHSDEDSVSATTPKACFFCRKR